MTITSASLRAFVAAILHAYVRVESGRCQILPSNSDCFFFEGLLTSIDAFTAVVATSRLVRSLKIELLLLLSPFLWVLDDVSCDVAHAAF